MVSHRERDGQKMFGGYHLAHELGRIRWELVDPVLGPFAGPGDSTGAQIVVDCPNGEEWHHVAANVGSGPWELRIGASDINSAEFDGDLDDVRIYDRALAPSEVAALFAAGAE